MRNIMKTKLFRAVLVLTAAVMILGGVCQSTISASADVVYAKTSVADPLTVDDYKDDFGSTTDSIGRIWTDKSVSTESITVNGQKAEKDPASDFQVVMSAISSSGLLSETEITPLDITLVLDMSGSMMHQYDTSRYEETYYVDKVIDSKGLNPNTLFVKADGKYREVHAQGRKGNRTYFYYDDSSSKVTIQPKTSPGQSSGVQTYCYRSRLGELRDSAASFAGMVRTENNKISDPDRKNRISVVSFSKDVKRDFGYTVPDSSMQEHLQNLEMRAMGETATHLAMKEAAAVSRDARPDAKQIVILFTDGKPFFKGMNDNFVHPAEQAVGHAQTLKNGKADIYTIGMFDLKTPDDKKVLPFMEAVSSEYTEAELIPEAGYSDFTVKGVKNTDGVDYARTVDTGNSLDEIFKDIFNNISTGSGYSTDTDLGKPDTSGYVTYTDTLGGFMTVDSFDGIVFGDKVYRDPVKTSAGKIDTYVFSGKVSTKLTESADLNKIIINVDRSGKCEVVTVKIPASVLPVYWYEIRKTNGKLEGDITPALPVRILYSVSLSDEAVRQLASGRYDESMKAYISAHSDKKNGTVDFYSNDYSFETGTMGGQYIRPEAKTGFSPNPLNNFYTYSEDSPVFTDRKCSIPAAEITDGGTYYIQWDYYDMSEKTPVLRHESIEYISVPEFRDDYITKDGRIYVKAGTPREQQIHNANRHKIENPTQTAGFSIYPDWRSRKDKTIDVWLGNNGRLTHEIPGSLDISKTVVNDISPENIDKDSFSFSIRFEKDGMTAGNSFHAEITDAAGKVIRPVQGEEYLIRSGDSFTLKHGQNMHIAGLPGGISYTVTEEDSVYEPSVSSGTGAAVPGSTAEGVTASGKTDRADFTNTYKASSAVLSRIPVRKTLKGRDITAGDEFRFTISAVTDNAPMPADTELILKGGDNAGKELSGSFGRIIYKDKGIYEYKITEAASDLSGMKFSEAEYKVKVEVSDDGKGKLKAASEIYRTIDDSGKADGAKAEEAAFVNSFRPEPVTAGFEGRKTVEGRELGEGDYSFELTDVNGKVIQTVENKEDGKIIFSDISFKDEGIYTYFIKEKAGSVPGMTYDKGTVRAEVKVTYDRDAGKLKAETSYQKDNGKAGADFVFSNVYRAEPADYSISGTKKLISADPGVTLGDGQFEFAITADKGTPLPANTSVKNDSEGKFAFGAVRYTEPGVYKYKVSEISGSMPGYSYDDTVYEVTVTVTDVNGKLGAEASVKGGNDKDIVFSNSYSAESVTMTGLKAFKKLEGRPLDAGEFRFTLMSGDKILQTASNDKDGNVQFDDIEFTRAGTYDYRIKEEKGNLGGVSWDDREYTVTVKVADADAKLKVVSVVYKDAAGPVEKAVFTNTYRAEKTQYAPEVTKKFTGRDWTADDSFSFTLKASGSTAGAAEGNDPAVIMPESTVSTGAASGNAAKASFGNIIFTRAGTYTFEISENIPADKNGIIYDEHKAQLTVTVTDDHKGHLSASVKKEGYDPVFENSFRPEPVTAGFEGSKTVEGKDLGAGDYSFELTDVNGKVIQTVENKEDGKIIFSDISFKDEGTYTYFIKEKAGSVPGMTYDKGTVRAEVKVTYDRDAGKLKAETSYQKDNGKAGADFVFSNVYRAEPAEYSISGTKKLISVNSDAVLRDGQFEFVITADKGTPLPENTSVKNDAEGKFAFGAVRYTEPGVYKYKVSEISGSMPGYSYDDTVYEVTVTVTDVNGKLGAEALVKGGNNKDIVFSNSYDAGMTVFSPEVTKIFKGRKWTGNDRFSFVLTQCDDEGNSITSDSNVTMPEDTTITLTDADIVSVKGEGMHLESTARKSFGNITFSRAGNYRFAVREKIPSEKPDEMTYDSGAVFYDVNVRDSGGRLDASVSSTESGKSVFTNTFDPADAGISVTGEKKLEGRPMTENDVWTFTISKAEGMGDIPMPAASEVTNDKDGNIDFGRVAYTRPGEYRYVIREKDREYPGITNDLEKIYLTVDVDYDPVSGKLKATTSYVKGDNRSTDGFTVTNRYTVTPPAPVDVFTGITKRVDASDGNSYTMKDGDFSFRLTPAEGNPESDPVSAKTVVNTADGNVSIFDDVIYTVPGTYIYTVSEVPGSAAGMIYDSSVYTVTVKVSEDRSKAKLAADVSIDKDGSSADSISFTNKYDPEKTSAQFGGTKELDIIHGENTLREGDFAFELKTLGNAPAPEQKIVRNDASGGFTFGNIVYESPGTYRYVISEVDEGRAGYIYSGQKYDITVTVSDIDGKLSAEVTGADSIVFTNSYAPASVSAELKAEKVLKGRKLEDGEFAFELIRGDKVIGTAVNDAEGNIVFSPLTYNEPGVYTYSIIEKDDGKGGVAYDKEVYQARVEIAEKDGKLTVASVAYTGSVTGQTEKAVFRNGYRAADTQIRLGAVKELKGRDLKAGEFGFELKNSEGEVISTASNDADGNIIFGNVVFSTEGEYTFTASEITGSDRDIIYDGSEYKVTVKVSDNRRGSLTAEILGIEKDGTETGSAVFTNRYDKGGGGAQTGDSSGMNSLILLMGAAAAALCITVIRRKI